MASEVAEEESKVAHTNKDIVVRSAEPDEYVRTDAERVRNLIFGIYDDLVEEAELESFEPNHSTAEKIGNKLAQKCIMVGDYPKKQHFIYARFEGEQQETRLSER